VKRVEIALQEQGFPRTCAIFDRNAMDALSDVLKSVRLEGAVYRDAEFSAPWCVQAKYGIETAGDQLAGAEHVMFFHFLIEGHCKVRLASGGEVLEARAGDLVLLPQDDKHIMGTDLRLEAIATEKFLEPEALARGGLVPLRAGGGGEITRFVCGYVACSRSVCRPLLEALPRALLIPIGGGPASAALHELLRMGVRESSGERPGSGSLLAKLSELMLVEALRRRESLPPTAGAGSLAYACAVGPRWLFASGPGRGWTVDEPARGCAIALGARRAIHCAGRRAADPLPDALAPAPGCPHVALGPRRRRARR
jgi:hypothetical protein